MTLKEARQILRPPLVFGNVLQIEAHHFLMEVEEAKDAIRACSRDHTQLATRSALDLLERICHIARCGCLDDWLEKDQIRLAAAEDFVAEELANQ